jgi:flavin-dependent dehydrogenase
VCGDFVSPKGLHWLEDLGCYEEIARRGYTPILESTVYLNGRKLSEGSLPHLAGHPPFGHAVPRGELDEVLFRRAQQAGAETVEDCRVDGYHATPSLVCVETRVGGRPRRFAGRVVVGADGANSTIARAAGLENNDPRYVLASMRAYCTGPALRRTVLFFDEEFFPGFGWIFPIRGELSNVGVGMVKEPLTRHRIRLRDFYRRFEEFVRMLARRDGTECRITPTAGWPIKTYGGAQRSYFERGLLIGEAGSLVDPISGEGIPLALECAGLARQTLELAFERGDFSAAMLADYETRWRRRWDADLQVSDLVVSMIRNRHLVKLWLWSFKVMGMTALADRDYALKTGGILAGLVPNREAFSPEVILKSVLHGPAFWAETFDLPAAPPLPALLERGLALLRWQAEVGQAILRDADWFRRWAAEVAAKQQRLAATLAGRPSLPTPAPATA